MKIFIDPHVILFLKNLNPTLKADVDECIELFEDTGFALFPPVLKKLSGYDIWELRPKNIRLLLGKIANGAVVVVGFCKHKNQTPKRYIKLALNRLQSWQ